MESDLPKNIALLELSESHGECIYSQVLFLQGKECNLHLVVNERLRDQTGFEFSDLRKFYFKAGNSVMQRMSSYLKIRRYILGNKIDTVIFNTSTGRIVQELLLFLPKRLNFIGTIHDGRKLVNSRTQSYITKKIKNYFVLNDYVKDYILKNSGSKVKLQTYYPIFFPPTDIDENIKPKDEFWIVIPGKVEQKRRNYLSLIRNLDKDTLHSNIKFILLGPGKQLNGDGELIENHIKEKGLENNFITFDYYVSNKDYFSYLVNADLIMPAIEPGNEFYETYKYSQITGAYNLAFGFHIPLLYHEDLNNIPDLISFGISYSEETLFKVIKSSYENREILSGLVKKITEEPAFTLQNQSRLYFEFVKECSSGK